MSFPYFLLIVITVLNLALAIFVYSKNRRSSINLSFGLIALSVSAWALTNGVFQATEDLGIAFIIAILSYIAAVMIAASFFWFSLVFPEETSGSVNLKKRALIVSLPAMIGLILVPDFVTEAVTFTGYGKSIVTGPGLYLFALYVIALFAMSFISLIKKYRTSTGRYKAQLKYVFAGTFLSVIGGVFFNLILPLFGNYRFVWLGPNFSIIMVAFIGYAIVKLRLMDIRIVLAKSIIYTVLLSVLGSLYDSLEFSMRTVETTAEDRLIPKILIAILIALSFQFLNKVFTKITKRILFKGSYSPQELLSKLGRVLSENLIVSEIIDESLAVIIKNMKIKRGAFILLDKDKNYRIFSSGFEKPLDLDAAKIDLILTDKVLVTDELSRDSKIAAILRENDIYLSAALSVKDEHIGLLVMGENSSGDTYSNTDMRVLEAFAEKAAIAIKNAESYEELKRFNYVLKRKLKKRQLEHG